MIDHLMTFASEAAAKADAVVGTYVGGDGSWRGDICIPNVAVTVTATGQPFDSSWRIVIAKPTQDAALSALSSCHLVTDRDAAAAGQSFILQSVLSTAQLAALTLSPVFAGSNYPFGNPS